MTNDSRNYSSIVIDFLGVLPAEIAEAVRHAAIPHFFDAGILSIVMQVPKEKAEEYIRRLEEMPFVIPLAPCGLLYIHELARQSILNEMWNEDPQLFRELNLRAARAFEKDAPHKLYHQKFVEAVYHYMVADPERALDMIRSIMLTVGACRHVAHAIIQYAREHESAGRLNESVLRAINDVERKM